MVAVFLSDYILFIYSELGPYFGLQRPSDSSDFGF